MISNENHTQLLNLRADWNHPDEILNRILWAFTYEEWPTAAKSADAYDDAVYYLNYMVTTGFDTPEDAWIDWCRDSGNEKDVNNNPFAD